METLNVNVLVEDYTIYPRCQVDNYHVKSMIDSLMVGVEFPAIVADKKSLRIADGFHRVKATKKLYGKKGTITVILKDYQTESELFLDAVKFNSGHGRSLDKYDKTHCIIKAGELNISNIKIARALNLTKEKAGLLRVGRIANQKIQTGKKKIVRHKIPLKYTIEHMAGKDLTQIQIDTNEKLSGMSPIFTVNQIIMLIEADLLDKSNERLMDRMQHLKKLMNKF